MFWLLVNEIKKRLTTELSGSGFRSASVEPSFTAPIIRVAQSVPKKPAGKGDTPGVLIVPVEMTSEGQVEKARVSLVIQTFSNEKSNEEPGLHELANLADAVKRALERPPLLGGRFELEPNVALFQDLYALHPFYRAEMVTNWTWPAPSLAVDAGQSIDIFGSGMPEDD